MKTPAIIALLLLSACAGEDAYTCEAGSVKIPANVGVPTAYECDDLDRCQGPLPWTMTMDGDLVVLCTSDATVMVAWM